MRPLRRRPAHQRRHRRGPVDPRAGRDGRATSCTPRPSSCSTPPSPTARRASCSTCLARDLGWHARIGSRGSGHHLPVVPRQPGRGAAECSSPGDGTGPGPPLSEPAHGSRTTRRNRAIQWTAARPSPGTTAQVLARGIVAEVPAAERGNLRREGTWAVIDQVISSGTNFVPALILARLLGPSAYGTFSLAFLAWFLTLTVIRSAIMQPYTLAAASLPPHRVAGELTSQSAGVVLSAGFAAAVCFGLAGLLVGVSSGLGRALLAVAVLAPGLALQEFWRVASSAAHRARTAALNDGYWALGQTVAFVVLLVTVSVTPAGRSSHGVSVRWLPRCSAQSSSRCDRGSIEWRFDPLDSGPASERGSPARSRRSPQGCSSLRPSLRLGPGTRPWGCFGLSRSTSSARSSCSPSPPRVSSCHTSFARSAPRMPTGSRPRCGIRGCWQPSWPSTAAYSCWSLRRCWSMCSGRRTQMLRRWSYRWRSPSRSTRVVTVRDCCSARRRGPALLTVQVVATGSRLLAVAVLTTTYGVVGAAWGLVVGSVVASCGWWTLVAAENLTMRRRAHVGDLHA